MRILGIETSCDECSASVVERVPSKSANDAFRVLSLVTHSQEALHRPFGGVVPEIASRSHLETINPVIQRALEGVGSVDLVAVTNRPGLVGALLVGVSAAKALAYAWGKPLAPVNHLAGHAASLFLPLGSQPPGRAAMSSPVDPLGKRSQISPGGVSYPLALSIVSGGHTSLYALEGPPIGWPKDWLVSRRLGRSRDDAAGECFDKCAKLIGLSYPGGVEIDLLARSGDREAFRFPRPLGGTLDFSFSGLKTAFALEVSKRRQAGDLDARKADLAASLQEAILDVVLDRLVRGARERGCRSLAIVGGVSANSRLRERLAREWDPTLVFSPDPRFSTDNAAMIAVAGAFAHERGEVLRVPELLTVGAFPSAET